MKEEKVYDPFLDMTIEQKVEYLYADAPIYISDEEIKKMKKETIQRWKETEKKAKKRKRATL